MSFSYRVQFTPGRYKVSRNPVNESSFMIGREEDGRIIGFAFNENDAMMICLGLNLADAQVSGDKAAQLALLREIEKLQH